MRGKLSTIRIVRLGTCHDTPVHRSPVVLTLHCRIKSGFTTSEMLGLAGQTLDNRKDGNHGGRVEETNL